ncbi:DUF6461 domain-containing protein [Streptomyces sp. NPDC006134]|uniref:DUF6461 domain-containing protein n=1 Tax=Streptomyces sp. NPDC006134 TaxID=3154467 RepID=UPI003407CE30
MPDAFGQGFSLTFVRDVPVRELLGRFGCAPGSIRPSTLADARELELEDEDDGAVICAGRAGGWSFALQSWGARILEEGVIERVSAGAEMVGLISTASAPAFVYAVDGEEICGFDPGLPHLRYGADPDRFLARMAQAGMPADGTPVEGSPTAAMLRFAEAAFGLSLPQSSTLREELLSGRVPEDPDDA